MLVSEVVQEIYEKKDVTHRGGLSLEIRPAEKQRSGRTRDRPRLRLRRYGLLMPD